MKIWFLSAKNILQKLLTVTKKYAILIIGHRKRLALTLSELGELNMLFENLRVSKLQTINGIESRIAELQELLSQEQSHLQAIGSVEQAAMSALNQVSQAIQGISGICPSELQTFKEQVLGLFDTDRPLLPPIVDTPPENPDQTTEVELVDTDRMIVDTPPENPDQTTDDTDRIVESMPISDIPLEDMPIQKLRQLARSRGVSLRGRRTHTQIVEALRAA